MKQATGIEFAVAATVGSFLMKTVTELGLSSQIVCDLEK